MKKQPYLYVAYESIRRLSYIQSLGKISKNSITDEVQIKRIMELMESSAVLRCHV